ncbi:MAG: ABC transporter substrate-binding protein, partial [Candidatus Eremiobacteraeota bacterium]|nr:ABC transporter substrate-binding protein [Candidatus Eremiobacteraeota bacterium]
DGYVFPYDKPNFTVAAKTILTKNPDYVFLAGKTNDIGPLVAALRTSGYKGRFGASEGFYNADTLKLTKDLGDDFIVSTSMPPLDRAPIVVQQLSDLRSRYGGVTPLQAFGYAAAEIVIAASRRTSSNRLAVLSALQNGGTYQTLVGSFTFTPTGDPLDPNLYFYKITDDKFKYMRPSHVSNFVI